MPDPLDLKHNMVVHRAEGMVAAQSDCTIPEAHDRLAQYADEHDETILATSRRVVERSLRFEP